MMQDEFDDLAALPLAPAAAAGRPAPAVGRLVCRLYRAATPALRGRLLACLLKPLGTLGTVGVAAGAFGGFLYRGGAEGARAAWSDVARFSNDQVLELARFVEQVSPEALQDFARLVADRPVGMAAFSASAALLLMQMLSQRGTGAAAGPLSAPGARSPGT